MREKKAYQITEEMLEAYREALYRQEKRTATVQKYMADLRRLQAFTDSCGGYLNKERMIRYKEYLRDEKRYKSSSINSYLVAANRFFAYMGWHELKVKILKIQRRVFLPRERELTRTEYKKLVRAAQRLPEGGAGEKGGMAAGRGTDEKTCMPPGHGTQGRMAMVLQTLCGTGMRVGELSFVTVKAVQRGTVTICNKGKERTILLPRSLQMRLLGYIRKHHIVSGRVFATSGGKALDRSYIWREMKKLCAEAGVESDKVFPHNLRALFARTYYEMFRDIAKLADLLGHESIETTRIYIRSSGEEHRRQLDGMRLVDV